MSIDPSRQQQAMDILHRAGILPVVTVHSIDEGLAVAEALARGGLTAIELTLRTPDAIAALRAIKQAQPALVVGAGTVLTPAQLEQAQAAGADFVVTPGTSPRLLDALVDTPLPAVPGAATPSELMALSERGFRVAKLFPAAVVGGLGMIKALHGPLAQMHLCPTGGIGESDAADYLAQPNVVCIGGSWMVPRAWLQAADFERVAASATRARAIIAAARG